MKNSRIKLTRVLAMFICGLCIISCSKDSEENSVNAALIPKSSPPSSVLGDEHNAVLAYAISEIDFSRDSIPVETAIRAISDIPFDFSSPSTCTKAEFIQISRDMFLYMDSIHYNLDLWGSNPYSPGATVILKQVLEIFKDVKSISDINSIYLSLDSLKSDALSLSGQEKDFVEGTIDIAKSSAYFWAPINIGGQGYFTYCNHSKASWSWGNAVFGDAVASMGWVTSLGVAGIITAAAIPGSNVVLVSTWAVSTAIASTMSGIRD